MKEGKELSHCKDLGGNVTTRLVEMIPSGYGVWHKNTLRVIMDKKTAWAEYKHLMRIGTNV